MNACCHVIDIEIHEKPHLLVCNFEVCHELFEMDGLQFLDRLQFYDNLVLDKQIQTIVAWQSIAIIYHRERNLLVNFQSFFPQLIYQ